MVAFIFGGSCSGKSAYAEGLVGESRFANRYYLATMAAADDESKKRIARHREARKGLGFITLEYPKDVDEASDSIIKDSFILLECISNLVANEMFMQGAKHQLYASKSLEEKTYIELLSDKIVSDISLLASKASDMVIVSNNIFEDGHHYDKDTLTYIEVLGRVNQKLATLSDRVTEVIAGIPISLK